MNDNHADHENAEGPDARLASELLVAGIDLPVIDLCREIGSSVGMLARVAEDTEMMFEALESGFVDVLVLGERFSENADFELLRHVRYWYPETQVIIVSAEPRFSSAVVAIKLGAYDYLPEPLDRDTLQNTIERAMEQRHKRGESRSGEEELSPGKDLGIVGQSPAINKLSKLIRKLAFNVHPVLILGESGTGKELVARAIHFHGSRREQPFIPIDCGALVPTLMESELFGHERGSFTGAERAKDGLLRIAEGGTVFFDEIGELPAELQGKLLRALQEKEIRPVGSTKRIRIDVRVIAATNRDLEAEVRAGTFRKDLYFRLNVVTLKPPPLRDRIEDIKELSEWFLDRIAKNTGQPRKTLSAVSMRMLQAYSWPGNVRELENFIERAVALSTGETLEPVDFPTQISSRLAQPNLNSSEPLRRGGYVYPLNEVERHAILNAVTRAKGDKLLAARMLGIGKTTLYRKLKRYELEAKKKASDISAITS